MNIGKDFPITDKLTYFDSACMSLKPTQVINAISEYYREYPACAGRSNHKLSSMVTEKVDEARKKISKLFSVKKEEVVFTRNTTEGINLVAKSFENGKSKIITSDKEHNSNLIPWQIRGNHVVVKSDENNIFDIEDFENKIDKKTCLVSIVHTSNLDGVTNPVKEISKISHDYEAKVLIDGAQSSPHKEINLKKIGADFFSCSGHKMMGPTGTGILFGKKDLLEEMKPFIVGGDTVENSTYRDHEFLGPPEKFEGGLQNYAGIIGFGAAVDYIKKIGFKKIENNDYEINKIVTETLLDNGAKIIGPENPAERGSITSFFMDAISHHEISGILNEYDIMTRSGRHCVHSWFNARKIEGTVRVSSYIYNTKEDAERFSEVFRKIKGLLK